MGLFSKAKKAVKSVVKKVTNTAKSAVKTVAAPVAAAVGLGSKTVQDFLGDLGLGGLVGGDSNSGLNLGNILQFAGTLKQVQAQNDAAHKQWQFAQQQLANQNQLAQQNMQMQKTFAQNGIQWRVNDAKAAGLHPLIGAGAQTSTFSPVASVGVGIPEAGAQSMIGETLSQLGQGIERAQNAAQAKEEREFQERLRAYQLMNLELQNEETVSRIGLNQARIKELERVPARIQSNVSKGIPLMRGSRQAVVGQRDTPLYNGPIRRFFNRNGPTEKEAQKYQNLWGIPDVLITAENSAIEGGGALYDFIDKHIFNFKKRRFY